VWTEQKLIQDGNIVRCLGLEKRRMRHADGASSPNLTLFPISDANHFFN